MGTINKITVGNDNYNIEVGVKVQSTVSGDTVSFTNDSITNNAIIDGPYIQNVLLGLTDVSFSDKTVTYTLSSSDGNGATAYIWVRG